MKNLYEVTKSVWGLARANQLVLDAISSIFYDRGKLSQETEDLKKQVILSGVAGEVIFADFAPINREAWGQLISKIFEYSIDSKINLSDDPKFFDWKQSNSTRLMVSIEEGAFSNYWGRLPYDYIGMIEAGFDCGGADPEKIFKRRYSRNKSAYKSQFDIALLRAIARRSTNGMIQAVEDTEFYSRLSYQIRSEVYISLASVGKLTAKAARRIRSDSSEEASEFGVKAIADNITKFSNAAEVLSQVMDTKHHQSAMYLAKTIPVEYLPFMAVCQNQSVREVVVNRMQQGASNV